MGTSRQHFFLLCAFGASCLSAPAAEPTARPNVLFIIMDDLTTTLSCYGDRDARTPHMDALAARGVRFDRAYTQFSLCGPTRASFLTGCYPERTQVYDLSTSFRDALPDAVTLPQLFKNAGYTAGCVGKVFHVSDAAWTKPDLQVGAPLGYDQDIFSYEKWMEWSESDLSDSQRVTTVSSTVETNYNRTYASSTRPACEFTDYHIADSAISALESFKGKPFFLAVGFIRPHTPYVAPEFFFNLLDPLKIAMPAYYQPGGENTNNIPVAAMRANNNIFPWRAANTNLQWRPNEYLDEARGARRAYLAATAFADSQVGRLLAKLKQLNLDTNTIIVLTGDHGYQLGEHGLWAKQTLFEEGTHVPLMVVAPGVNPGVCTGLVEQLDIYPTIAGLAGLPLPGQVQGLTLQPLLTDPSAQGKAAVFSTMQNGTWMGHSIRTDRYRYNEWDAGGAGLRQLYDHETDPHELNNLAELPSQAELVAALHNQLTNHVFLAANPAITADFTYMTNGTAITITGYTGSVANIVIPSSIVGKTVTAIGADAFSGRSSLTNVAIPAGITNIGDHAFYWCTGLKAITVDAANTFYSSANGVLFDKNQTTIIQSPAGKFSPSPNNTYSTPVTVKTISAGAFASCTGLVQMTIGSSVTNIGDGAFSACALLQNLTLSTNITSIGDSVFSGCSLKIAAAIPAGVTNIGPRAFSSCSGWTNVIIPSGVTSIGAEAFSGEAKLVNVTITGNGLTNIGSGAFASCVLLTNVTIPASVTDIGSGAFASCAKLSSVTIPAGVTNIGAGAFNWCNSLNGLTVNSSNSFYSSADGVLFDKNQTVLIQCPGNKSSYAIPGGITNIGNGAFYWCTNLTSVTIPGTVASIGRSAFEGCSLTSLTIPDSITSIGDWAFYWCNSLTNVIIGNGVTSIGTSAFSDCSRLTSVTMGGSVTSIGDYAFEGCGLTGITTGNNVTNIGNSAFTGCSLTRATIGKGVTDIGNQAFFGCRNLSEVYFKGNAPGTGSNMFAGVDQAVIYYLTGTTGWESMFAGLSAAMLNPVLQACDRTPDGFGFNITGPSNHVVVVEVCTNLTTGWVPVETNILTGGTTYFSDPFWTNHPNRYYRVSMPQP